MMGNLCLFSLEQRQLWGHLIAAPVPMERSLRRGRWAFTIMQGGRVRNKKEKLNQKGSAWIQGETISL